MIAKERYAVFKLIIVNLVKQKIDNTKYEDLLRSIFGKKSFIFFTIDKILAMVIWILKQITKSLQSIFQDEFSNKILQLVVNFQTHQRS